MRDPGARFQPANIETVSEQSQQKPPVSLAVRFILIASLVLFLLATVSEVYRSPPTPEMEPIQTESSAKDTLIVPGVRVGALTLGLSTGQLNELLGKGILRPHDNGLMHLYEELGIVIYSEKDKIVSVTVRSPLFKTRGGVGAGSDVSDVLQQMGSESEKVTTADGYILHNWKRGWHAGVRNEKVEFFQITLPLEAEPRP